MPRAAASPLATSAALDMLRSAAAIVVLLGHAVQLGVYTGAWPFDATFQHGAVVVFFVLSGFLIHRSAFGAADWRAYAIARAARILPVSVFAVGFAALVHALLAARGVAPGGAEAGIGIRGVVGPLLFLSERWTTLRPPLDPPYWSLCYEVWFYAIFGAWFFLRGPRRWIVVLALAEVAGARVLLLMPAWLLGAGASAMLRRGVVLPRPVAVLLVATAGVAASVATGSASIVWTGVAIAAGLPDLGPSSYFIVDTAQAAGIAIALMALHGLRIEAPPPPAVARVARRVASLTFTLYLTHWPLLSLCRALGMTAGSSWVGFCLILLIPLGFAALLAPTLEGRGRAALADWLDALSHALAAAGRQGRAGRETDRSGAARA